MTEVQIYEEAKRIVDAAYAGKAATPEEARRCVAAVADLLREITNLQSEAIRP